MVCRFHFAHESAPPGAAWSHLEVASFHGTEQISALYRYELVLVAPVPDPDFDPASLVGTRAALQIDTDTTPEHRVVHGVIVEAEELQTVAGWGTPYRVVLMPPLARASYRTRSRVFVDQTTREIVEAVLGCEPLLEDAPGVTLQPPPGDLTAYAPATELYTWRVEQVGRIDSPTARPYCVQYNESDFQFLSRLLEEEGIGYHFENGVLDEGTSACLLVLADTDNGRPQLDPTAPLGVTALARAVTSMRFGARLRPGTVTLDDYNWASPDVLPRATAGAAAQGGALYDYGYPGGLTASPADSAPLAQARLDRNAVEARYCAGRGTCCLLSAGLVFTLDPAPGCHPGEYLVTRAEIRGEQEVSNGGTRSIQVPFEADLECLRKGPAGSASDSRFRPARVTPRPRIHGSQTALVTGTPTDPLGAVTIDGFGCVRLRFHWDRDMPSTPSSCWVRVSQPSAGGNQGGVLHPRVGSEVVVEFLDGDPDRPLVTGRVYNGANPPPTSSPTVSMLKTFSLPGAAGYNALTFEDQAGAEAITLNAARDLDVIVTNDRDESIGAASTSSVGADRSESTGGSRSTSVAGDDTEAVGGSETLEVGVDRTVWVGVNQTEYVGGAHGENVFGDRTRYVAGSESVEVDADRDTYVGDTDTLTVATSYTVQQASTVLILAGDSVTIDSPTSITLVCGQSSVQITPTQVIITSPTVVATGSTSQSVLTLNGSAQITSPTTITLTQGASPGTSSLTLDGDASVSGGAINLDTTSSDLTIDSSGDVVLTGGNIKLNS